MAHELVADAYNRARIKAEKLLREREQEARAIPGFSEILDKIIEKNRERIEAQRRNLMDLRISEIFKELSNLEKEKTAVLKRVNYGVNFLTDVYQCAKCEDKGENPKNGSRCECYKKRLSEAYMVLLGLEKELEKKNFKTFDISLFEEDSKKKMEEAKKLSEQFVEYFSNGQLISNLLFVGPVGSGKSFMLFCITKELIEKGFFVLHITASKLFNRFHDFIFDKTESDADFLKTTFEADLLVIDDLGSESASEPAKSKFLELIEERMSKNLPIAISTNLSTDEIILRYTDRILSRFMGDFQLVEFPSEDLRIKKVKRNLEK